MRMKRLEARVREGGLVLEFPLPLPDGAEPFLLWFEEHDFEGATGFFRRFAVAKLLAHAGADARLWEALEDGLRDYEEGRSVPWEEMKTQLGWDDELPLPEIRITELERWLGEHRPSDSSHWGVAFWDHIELVQRWLSKFSFPKARALGEYIIHTPPPEEVLAMPLIELERDGLRVVLKMDFSRPDFPHEWVVTVRSSVPIRHIPLGLFDPTAPIHPRAVSGIPDEHLLVPHAENPAEFSCQLVDDWDVATLLRITSGALEEVRRGGG
jgi:hypothetical protein